jgi:peptidoglycan hydrolase-like protein with peptidoglycan-binding domain
MITVLVLCLLGLLLLYAPRYLVRYLLASQLDEMHIDHSGVETLIINPFTRELWLGPVRIGVGTDRAARLESLGLTLGYDPLLHHRIFIERLTVHGIDLAVTRDQRNRFVLNGIPLSELSVSASPTGPTAEDEAWKPGIADFELRDSRLLFKDRGRGELAIDVERLSLKDFLAWEPDKPGQFELAARINEIRLNWSGEARPFADNITLSIDSDTEQADLPKVIRFTGPLGLDRRDGVYRARLRHELTFFHGGGFEGRSHGVIEVEGADYQREDVFRLAMQQASSDLDIRYALQASGDFSLQGKVAMDLEAGRVSIEDQTRVGVAGGRVVLDSLKSGYAKNGNLSVRLEPDLQLEQVAFSGPIEISVDKLLDLLALLQSISAGAKVAMADTGLGDFAGGAVAVPSSEVKVERVHSRGRSLSLESSDGKLEFDLKTRTELSHIQVDVDERRIEVERLQSELEHLSLTSGQGRLTLDMAGDNRLSAGSSNGPLGQLKVESLESRLQRFALQVQSGAITLQTAGKNRLRGFSGLVYARESLPAVRLQLGAADSTLSQATVDARAEALQWQAAGETTAEALSVEFAEGRESRMKFDRLEIQGLQADQHLQLAADTLNLDGLDLTLKRSLLQSLFKGKEGETKQAESQREGGDIAVAEPNALARAQALLKELGYDPGSVDGRMGPETAAAIEAFQNQQSITANGRLSAGLLAQLELRTAGPSADAEAPDLHIGRLAMSGEPTVRFHDDIVDPPVRIDTVFKTFQIQNLNTRKQAQKSDIRLAARVNKFTDLDLSGWTRGLSRAADLALELQVKNLELATYSPYVVKLAGVYLESGQLDTKVDGRATAGILQGQLQLQLDHMAFKPLSEEDAARVTDTMGVPLELAVSLLEDGKGRIALELPLGGTLTKPDVDISSAVNKAIGGVLKRVFPPTLAVSLVSKLAKGSGPAFEPILFTPGSAELDDTGRSYVDKLAEFLNKHPKLSLKLCGRATAQDLAQLSTAAAIGAQPASGTQSQAQPQAESMPAKVEPTPKHQVETLKELAIERKNLVRTFLIENERIAAKRIPECRSIYDAKDQSRPRVEIKF